MPPILTVSKRFEFAASHKLVNPKKSAAENWTQFGQDSIGTYGHGHNFVAHFQFQGPIDPINGMVVELSKIKSRVNSEILNRYDHFYLNEIAPFEGKIPTVEAIASQLLHESVSTFTDTPYTPSGVYLQEMPGSTARAYRSGPIERTIGGMLRHPMCGQLGFNAPLAVSATVRGSINPETGEIRSTQLGKAQLNDAIATQQRRAISSWIEIGTRLIGACPWASRIQIKNTPWVATFFPNHTITMQYDTTYTATHRLGVESFTQDENIACFGKCYRPHGHTFDVNATWSFSDLATDQSATKWIEDAMTEWTAVALHLTPEFAHLPASTEWMIHKLWDRLSHHIPLVGLRLLETPNNRFSLRKASDNGTNPT